ncbi:MAG: hypothetical protein ACJA0F_001223 [Dinoroseobacter sp.]|jgi:hypothetical protein
MRLIGLMHNDAARCARTWICVIYGPKGSACENQIHFFGGMAMPWVMEAIPLDQQSDADIPIAEHAVRPDQLNNGELIAGIPWQFAKPGFAPMKIPRAGRKKARQLIVWIAKNVGQDRTGGHLSRR